MTYLQQLPDASVDGESKFESLNHMKGMRQSVLLENTEEDVNSEWYLVSEGLMVMPTKKASRPSSKKSSKLKKKKSHKRTPLEEEAHTKVKVDLDEVQHEGNIGAGFEEVDDIPPLPPNPMVEPFTTTPLKGGSELVL